MNLNNLCNYLKKNKKIILINYNSMKKKFITKEKLWQKLTKKTLTNILTTMIRSVALSRKVRVVLYVR